MSRPRGESRAAAPLTLSVVATLYRSAPFVKEFHRRVSAAAAAVTDDYEIILVDDGSPDDSLEQAVNISRDDPHVVVIELSRNFGHHKAMMTGLRYARGRSIFLIDSDLEEDPAWLSLFWKTMAERDVDVVYGYQEARSGPALARIGGAIHWWLIRKLSSYPIPDNLVTVRLMTRQYVRSLLRHKETRTVIGGLWAITGYRQLGVPVAKVVREDTSVSLRKRFALAFEGITSFSDKPLMLVFYLGAAIFALSSVSAGYLVLLRLTGNVLAGWTSVLVSVWMLGGLAIASVGVLGLYTGRIFIETKHRPYSIVRRVHRGRLPD